MGGEGADHYLKFIDSFIDGQVKLIIEWMRVGFIHGVMNTDNTSLAGETIDYGPCAMMGAYDPGTVFSSIDSRGRYAFGNQIHIAQWNILRFVESILPLIHEDQQKALDRLEPLLAQLPTRFERAYLNMLGRKFGLSSIDSKDEALIQSLLDRMHEKRLDYTMTFKLLTESLSSDDSASLIKAEFEDAYDLWLNRLKRDEEGLDSIQELMKHQNPLVIPRNHHVEAILEQCESKDDSGVVENFLKALRFPYKKTESTCRYQDASDEYDKYYQTFCGT